MAALQTVPLEELKKMGVDPGLKSYRRAQDLKMMAVEEFEEFSTRLSQGFKAYCQHVSKRETASTPRNVTGPFPELNERCQVCHP